VAAAVKSPRAGALEGVVALFYICKMHNAEEFVARRTVDVAVIIPDASPVLTLARIERLDLFGSFTSPFRCGSSIKCITRSPGRRTTRRET
jgi:hypothetical protein